MLLSENTFLLSKLEPLPRSLNLKEKKKMYRKNILFFVGFWLFGCCFFFDTELDYSSEQTPKGKFCLLKFFKLKCGPVWKVVVKLSLLNLAYRLQIKIFAAVL